MAQQTNGNREAGFRESLKSDIRQSGFQKSVSRDYREVLEFFLDDIQKGKLKRMGWFKKIFVIPFWLFRAMYLHLTPARRLLLLIGVVMVLFTRTSVNGGDFSFSNGNIFGALLILFILLLELKDKIMARDELEAGRAVQTALMPEERPRFAGWDIWMHTIPANDVGGDMVDYIPVGDDRLGLSLGDVAGKGLGAALFMARLQATLHAIGPDRSTIEGLGKRLNEIFLRDGIPNRFASLVYLEISREDGEVHFLNAGHMPPLRLRGETITEMERGGPALGIMPGAEYHAQRMTLEGNDVLVVYSDGLTEARNESGEFFGEERFRRLIGRLGSFDAETVGKHIVERTRHFMGDARQHDDISLLILRREG
ncbi:MAG: serine/threonine-protein phosphatase [Bacteroidetes bacterium]|nr:serine/threonine-protein phosphatase [Bacteroidota bacterium]